MKKTVYIVIGCDTDPDRADYLPEPLAKPLSWQGMLNGIPRAKERLYSIKDSDGKQPTISWCLRADHQIKELYGSYAHILKENREFFKQLESDGDELAWHPHFWRRDETTDAWYQDCFDHQWQTTMLENAYREYQEVLPQCARSVRMGWDYHNNDTFATLEELGVEVDFSGIPGLCIQPKNKSVRAANFFDWSLSPNRPYFPSKSDYRREADDGETSFSLLESPNFVSESRLWGLVSGLVLTKKMRDPKVLLRSLRKPTYWIGITGNTRYFMPLIAQVDRTLRRMDRVIFVTYFHPDELIDNTSGRYSLDYMEQNISLLVDTVKTRGHTVRFIKACDIKQIATSEISE